MPFFLLTERSWKPWCLSRLQATPRAGKHFEVLWFWCRFWRIWMSLIHQHSFPWYLCKIYFSSHWTGYICSFCFVLRFRV